MTTQTDTMNEEASKEIRLTLKESIIALIVMCLVSLVSNWAGAGTDFFAALPAMLIIFAMVVVGMLLSKFIPIGFPAVAWVSLVSVLLTIPVSPIAAPILAELKNISFLAMVTPVLAYAAMAITKMEVDLFKRSGFKIAVISILVFTGTYIGSALIANAFL
ncbi:MAG: hypothetical protein ACSHXJ_03015 [Marinomonas colpomeniae]